MKSLTRLVVLGLIASNARAAILKGRVLLNSDSGAPCAHVHVSAVGAAEVLSGYDGEFVLRFAESQVGGAVVVKDGCRVVNDRAGEMRRLLPREPDAEILTIVISRSPDRDGWALEYYKLKGVTSVNAKYRAQLDSLTKELVEERAKRNVDSERTQQLIQERDRLSAERDQAVERAEANASRVALGNPPATINPEFHGNPWNIGVLLTMAYRGPDRGGWAAPYGGFVRKYLTPGMALEFDYERVKWTEKGELVNQSGTKTGNYSLTFAYGQVSALAMWVGRATESTRRRVYAGPYASYRQAAAYTASRDADGALVNGELPAIPQDAGGVIGFGFENGERRVGKECRSRWAP